MTISQDELETFGDLSGVVDMFKTASAFEHVDMLALTRQYEDRRGRPLM